MVQDRSIVWWKDPVTLLCLALICASVACKMLRVNSRELWLDETFSAFVAHANFANVFRSATGDLHPPLFHVLLWGWVRLVGDAQSQLRLFSVLVNLCSIAAMYLLGARLLGTRFGALAAALFALSPMLFVYSLEVRSYMLLILAFVCVLLVHWKLVVEESDSRWTIAGYALAAAVLLYVHYVGGILLIGLLVHGVLRSGLRRARLARILAVLALTVLLVSPEIPLLRAQYATKKTVDRRLQAGRENPNSLIFGKAVEDPTEARERKLFWTNSVGSMAGIYPARNKLVLLVCALPLAGALLYAGFLWWVKGDPLCQLFAILTITMAVASFIVHAHSTRYILPLVPVVVLALARVVQSWTEPVRLQTFGALAGALILLVYVAGFWRQAESPHGRHWGNLVDTLQQEYRPGDLVVFNAIYAQVPFDYFARHQAFHPREQGFPVSIYDWWSQQQVKGWGSPVILQSDVQKFVADLSTSHAGTVWLVLFEPGYYDPRGALLEKLGQLGQVSEVVLPQDGGAPDLDSVPPLHLMRVSLP